MMVFSTPYWKKIKLLALLPAFLLAALPAFAAQTHGIEVRRAVFIAADEHYVLETDIDIILSPPLEEALHKGISLYFLLEFELVRSRWYWFNEKAIANQQQYRLSFNALTRQYRIGIGAFYQNFPTLTEALEVMSKVRRREDIEPGVLSKGTSYVAGLRLRLDTSQLPKPFNLNALGSREWSLGSEWYRWTVTP
ncbi:MAG: DUF4390 domain-containing protein [Betaproteobacteria bacterium]|jgi:hypothetical protein|nr:DUF4390 domain-containing protein [Betaproteobacteria bacterium]MDH4292475.1 DUF4390 domain-containing protein [Betaproteobacteria bacterium]MDH5341230.1 DUF4390 domain-containing protein [Betaproteobacteria bacterium]